MVMQGLMDSPAWRRAIPPFALLWLAVLALYWQTAAGMAAIWSRSDTFAHAYLVPPIALWLIWRKRDQLATLTPRSAPWMLLLMAAVGLAWLLAELVAVNAATQVALVAMLVLAVPTVFGLQVTRVLLFPLAFAFFAVPVGEFAMPMLMQGTADFTVAALRASGVPVYREGLRFVIPSGSWSVVEACSGVRYLIASFMVGSLFAYLNYRSAKRRWIFVGVSLLVPIVANWLRAYMIVMLGHLSDNRIATGADHLVYGWLFFGVIITALFIIGARWAEPPEEPATAAAAAPAASSAPLPGWLAPALAAIVVAAPAIGLRLVDSVAGTSPGFRIELPDSAAGAWQAAANPPAAWSPSFENPSASAHRSYVDAAGHLVGVQLQYYRQQNTERKLISSTNVVVRADDHQWNPLSSSTRNIPTASGSLTVREFQLLSADASSQSNRQRLRVWQMYWINGFWTTSDLQAKLKGAWDRLRGEGDDAAAVMLYARDGEGDAADQALSAFVQANRDWLEARLAAARERAAAR